MQVPPVQYGGRRHGEQRGTGSKSDAVATEAAGGSGCGASREKLHVAPGQAEMFNEAETNVELNEVLGVEVSLKATPQREDKAATVIKAGRKAIAAHLPRAAEDPSI